LRHDCGGESMIISVCNYLGACYMLLLLVVIHKLSKFAESEHEILVHVEIFMCLWVNSV